MSAAPTVATPDATPGTVPGATAAGMDQFAALIDALVYTTSRNAKLRLIDDYLRTAPTQDRGWALAALTGDIDLPAVKSATIRAMAEQRFDPVLLRLSRDYVGDTAETVALLWAESPGGGAAPVEGAAHRSDLADIVGELATMRRAEAPAALAALLDCLPATARFAALKLATGGLRVGVSGRLARAAFAQSHALDIDAVEEAWHASSPPYDDLFAWAAGDAPPPDTAHRPAFRPFMLSNPLEERSVDLADYVAEWKWDGIRVQIVRAGGATRIFSRSGDDITDSFPDVASAIAINASLDGELMVRGDAQGGSAASFNALQQRLGRKRVSSAMLRDHPAFVRLYDVMADDGTDLRSLPWHARRTRLEALIPALDDTRFDLSPLIDVADFDALAELRDGARDAAIEGVMLKRRDAPYLGGRCAGLWYKWKRDPLVADCVMMYAQRGSGKRSSFYSDYTFGCWTASPQDGGQLLPVGKAYSGFTDAELAMLDAHVRRHTTQRFGPVREVANGPQQDGSIAGLVLEVAFDSIHPSKRHKSGLAMRFPRISRIRIDKPAAEADLIATLTRMIS